MTLEELFNHAATTGKLPMVEVDKPVRHAASNIGVVTTIKQTSGYTGVAVRFNGMNYDSWFHAIENPDRRSKYMSELKIKHL